MTSLTKCFHVTNYIVNVPMWLKFGNSNISMREVTIAVILWGFDKKTGGALGLSSIIWEWH